MAGGSLVRSGRAFFPQGVGASHRDVVKILQEAIDGGFLAGFVSSNDCLGIIKGILFKKNVSGFQNDGGIPHLLIQFKLEENRPQEHFIKYDLKNIAD